MMFRLQHLLGVLSMGISMAAIGRDERLLVGQTFMTGTLDPTQGSNPWALTSHGVAEKLFTVDKDGEIVGQLGESVTKINDTTWDVKIKSGSKFSNGNLVDAQHVAASLNNQNEENSGAQSSLGTMTVTVRDSMTVRIMSEKPTHIMESVLAEWAFVIYMKDSNNDFVFSGPFSIDHFEANDHMDLIPNAYYPAADERPLIEIKKYSDGHDLAKAVEEKQVDIGFHLPIDTLPELRDVDDIKIRSFEVGYHYMAFYNTDSVLDVRVREAIDKAIDRTELSQALQGGHPTRSFFPDNSPFYTDDSDPHGDMSVSKALLDQAGWVLNGNKRSKNGDDLTIRLVAYPHRPGLVIMQPYIAKAMEDLGITVQTILTGDNWDETQKIIDDRSFDMIMWAQHTLPAGDPAWFLNTFFHSDGGNNHANYESAAVDTMLGYLGNTEDHTSRVSLAADVQARIHEDVPVSNLVTPMWHVSINEDNVKDYQPYGSDYYVIRADLRANYEEEESSSSSSGSSRVHATLGVMAMSIAGLFLFM